ncbi:hypothetical protein BaRGS_00022715 [Batillaria attramentaria]|uniref:F-box domain-containing protein n=1 Tax=Batillaria attramentaria TaxID=370345 RepID=A0ABD0KGD5_9CAEN
MELCDEPDDTDLVSYIHEVPEEILELIFSYLSPYGDLKNSMLVCKQWYRLISALILKLQRNFSQMLRSNQMSWTFVGNENGPCITDRYSHCACYFQQSMYIFGGCTSTNTTFNDLWRFDLSTRQWVRPLAMGTYPSPKACASMVVYKDSLVLFGGWSHPTPMPLHQAPRYFSELHVYTPATNRWSQVMAVSSEGLHRVAGHSASIVGDMMVVFGGSYDPGSGCNEVRVYDFTEGVWTKPVVNGKKPNPRYGQSQVTLDSEHILILGGCGGPNQIFSDVWLLHMTGDNWHWEEITMLDQEFAPPQLWCHPACMVDDVLVVLSKTCRSKGATSSPADAAPIMHQANRVWVPPQAAPDNPPGQPPQNNAAPPHLPQPPPRPVMAAFHRAGASGVGHGRARGGDGGAAGRGAGFGHDPHRGADAEGRGLNPRVDGYHGDAGRGGVHLNNLPGAQNDASPGPSNINHHRNVAESDSDSDPNPDLDPGGAHAPRPGLPSVRPNAMHNRQRQLDMLQKHEDRLRNRNGNVNNAARLQNPKSTDNTPRNPMLIHVLDISQVLQSRTATWLPTQEVASPGAPDETIFYSLTEGRGELVLFGGIQKDPNSMQRINSPPNSHSHIVSNGLFVITPKWLRRL